MEPFKPWRGMIDVLRSKYLVGLLIALFFTVFSSQIFAESNQATTSDSASGNFEYEKNLQFRTEFGFNTAKEYIEDTIKNEKVGKYYVSLTESEEKEMDLRMKIQSEVPDILKFIKEDLKYQVDGLFFDNINGGILNIGFKDLEKIDKESIKGFVSESTRLKLYQVRYSESELNALTSEINKIVKDIHAQNISMVSISPSPITQKVEIGVEDISSISRLKNALSEMINGFEKNMVNISLGSRGEFTAFDRAAARFRAVPGGAQIGFSGSGFCTNGFTAKDDSNYYYISAGHCMGYAGQQVTQSYILPNLVAYANRESLYWATTADASASTIDPSNATSWIMNANSGGLINSQNNLIVAEQINEFVGMGVCMSLGQTNSNICTSVSDLNFNGNIGLFNWYTSYRKVLYTSVAGDSGSPVYVSCFECGNYVALYGMATANDGSSGGTYVAYIGNIKNELDVEVVKNNNNSITYTPFP
ncbi:hypothetical protein [Paenibacillus koleovorans]|uniref:hypothetical protein n=1 Tax=Paenibacillus koleovorans TaxID=121608 RepID=UPI000FD92EED|nr:hypothetical protein [Paenibacillus koleovorans]